MLLPPPSSGEVAASYADGRVKSFRVATLDPSVADYRATSPEDGGGKLDLRRRHFRARLRAMTHYEAIVIGAGV
ncbi:MAG TPA: hypothetical protein VK630_19410, partial [Reyranella sp.]|nr:hypothetical protein [Reyranella sp.]